MLSGALVVGMDEIRLSDGRKLLGAGFWLVWEECVRLVTIVGVLWWL